MRVLGVDSGQSGGLAIVEDGRVIAARRMPVLKVGAKKAVDGYELSGWIEQNGEFEVAVIEQVSAMPKQGVSSTFQFGRMFGGVESVLGTYGRPVRYVTPAVWKKAMHLDGAKQSSLDAFRLMFGAEAAALYTKYKADDGVAEAALLAAYAAKQGWA